MMRSMLVLASVVAIAGPAQAVTKFYDSSANNGRVGDFVNTATNLCPPVQTSLGILQGHAELTDLDAGTVTLEQTQVEITTFIDLGPDQLTVTFGETSFTVTGVEDIILRGGPGIDTVTLIGDFIDTGLRTFRNPLQQQYCPQRS